MDTLPVKDNILPASWSSHADQSKEMMSKVITWSRGEHSTILEKYPYRKFLVGKSSGWAVTLAIITPHLKFSLAGGWANRGWIPSHQLSFADVFDDIAGPNHPHGDPLNCSRSSGPSLCSLSKTEFSTTRSSAGKRQSVRCSKISDTLTFVMASEVGRCFD